MIDQLLACLQGLKVQLDPEELAEALWLAQYLAEPPRRSAGVPPPQVEVPTEEEPESSPVLPPATAGSRLVHSQRSSAVDEAVAFGHPVKVPAAPALPHSRELGQAFRPLRRRVSSRTQHVFDEEATARQVAETRGLVWRPVFAPARARWMELALVVDGSASMALWTEMIRELEHLLEQVGVFRNIRRWTLDTSDPSEVCLYAGHEGPAARVQRPLQELSDPAGGRLVLFVSDCISPGWHSGAVTKGLLKWSRVGPVALVQVLPQRLWVRTALRSATRTVLRARRPGLPNVLLESEVQARSRHSRREWALPMPIFSLERSSIAEWARMLAFGGEASLGLMLPPVPRSVSAEGARHGLEVLREERHPGAAQLIQDFRGTASPLAQELAGLLSAVPLTLPVMRLVQQAMLPNARQAHLAEVLLSGLMRQVKREEDAHRGSEAQFEFLPGVRERLLDSLSRSRSLEVLYRVADTIGAQFGQGRDFAAVLVDPGGEVPLDVDEANAPFAVAASTVLRRLGGRYARLATRLHPDLTRSGHVQDDIAASGVRSELPEITQRDGWVDSELVGRWLAQVRFQVCRIEVEGFLYGTGFLIGPDLILTNYHVVRQMLEGTMAPKSVVARFDYRLSAKGGAPDGGGFRLSEDWLVDASPPAPWEVNHNLPEAEPAEDQLDVAVLRLKGTPGIERGWLALREEPYAFDKGSPLYILQYSDGGTLELVEESRAVLEVNPNRTRVRYLINTLQGSSGSPCFNRELELVAIHHGAGQSPTGGYNEGIPIDTVTRRLAPKLKPLLTAKPSKLGQYEPLPRPDLEKRLVSKLAPGRSLLLLAPRRGGATTLAQAVAKQTGLKEDEITWLRPPPFDECSEKDYFSELAPGSKVKSPLSWKHWMKDRARSRRHLIVLLQDEGPVKHVRNLGRMLRALLDEAPGRFSFLAAGGENCARLRYHEEISIFFGLECVHVPDFTELEVGQLLERLNMDRRLARVLHTATGGHPGLLRDLLSREESLTQESATRLLVNSPLLQQALRVRLAAEARSQNPPRRRTRDVLAQLLRGEKVRAIDDEIADDFSYPEVRLYYDAIVRTALDGSTVFRCEAAQIVARQCLKAGDD